MKKLLKLLIAGGITVVIASSVAIGIIINKSKSTSTENTEPVVTNESISNNKTSNEVNTDEVDPKIASLSVSFKSLSGTELTLAKQAVLGITVGKNEEVIKNEITIIANAKEVPMLDLSKTMGNLEWIRKQVKDSNIETSTIGAKELHKVQWKQNIIFLIKSDKNLFLTLDNTIFGVEVKTVHVPAVKKIGEEAAKAESWEFIYSFKNLPGHSKYQYGILATSMPKIQNSVIFWNALNEFNLERSDFQVLLWKKFGMLDPLREPNTDGTDSGTRLILNKKTGKVFVQATRNFKIELAIEEISKPEITP